ncbi:MAG: lipopolysaccharide heptosyltransferase II [Candidatus Binataceae bacterium]
MPLQPPPPRILVKEVNWLGDVVMSLPALRAIRHTYADAHLAILIKRELAGFFDGIGWIDEVIPYSVARGVLGIGDRLSIVSAIRAHRFDLAVLFPNSFESALWVTMAGVPRRAGYIKDARGPMLTLKASPPPEAIGGHQVHYWLTMVRATVDAIGDAQDLAIEPSESRLNAMWAWIGSRRKHADSSLIAIAPAAAFGPAKEWPALHFARLIDELAEHHSAECVLIGAPGERAKCDQIATSSKAGAIVAAGETDVTDLVAILALANGFVGNDSGAMHVAAALGRPTVGIFGSTNPERTGPMGPQTHVLWRHLECSPCLARTCRFGHYNCLNEITPADAIAALRTLGAIG